MPPLPDELLEGLLFHIARQQKFVSDFVMLDHFSAETSICLLSDSDCVMFTLRLGFSCYFTEMPRLCAFGCKVTEGSLHTFPNLKKFPERFKYWVSLLGGKLETSYDYEYYRKKRVCDIHFTEDDRNRNNRLNALAVPSLHLPKLMEQGRSEKRHYDHSYAKDIGHMSSRQASLSGVKGVLQAASSSAATTSSQSATADVKDNDTITAKEVDELHTLGDGIIDDDGSPPSPVPDMETSSAEPLFSWEKSELIPADDPDEPELVEEIAEDPSGVSMYCDDVTSQDAPAERVSLPTEPITAPREVEYKCKECGETIQGFQFWCVQCLGCALCAACEARGAHNAHYVLRAPPHRPHRQTQVVLAAIRHQLQNENMLTTPDTGDGSVKLEVKEEPIEEEVTMMTQDVHGADPLAAPDPLETSVSDDDDESQVSRLEEDDLQEITEPQLQRAETPDLIEPQPKRSRLADFVEQDFVAAEKPKGLPLPVKVTGAPPPQKMLVDLDEYEEVEYLDTEGLENIENNSNIMILGDADRNIVVQRVVTDNEDDDTFQILGNVGNDWIVQRGVTVDTEETENRLPLKTRGPQELMARSLTTKAVVKLQPLSSVEIRRWTASKRRRLN